MQAPRPLIRYTDLAVLPLSATQTGKWGVEWDDAPFALVHREEGKLYPDECALWGLSRAMSVEAAWADYEWADEYVLVHADGSTPRPPTPRDLAIATIASLQAGPLPFALSPLVDHIERLLDDEATYTPALATLAQALSDYAVEFYLRQGFAPKGLTR